MNESFNDLIDQENDNKVDWDEVVGKSPKYIEINKFQFFLVILILVFGFLVIQNSILGMWKDGDQ
ncbi:MAG: hypothetical protein HeimC2_31160 [Candidatus Heimdallarchaeota archaeon LC_2]|nr:MAG: hypothetical protein HeimC2_31160 [Candidatus Heimdallarchaeota archaeon LC_2]